MIAFFKWFLTGTLKIPLEMVSVALSPTDTLDVAGFLCVVLVCLLFWSLLSYGMVFFSAVLFGASNLLS